MNSAQQHSAPERAFLKACHPESPSHNCTWAWCGSEPKEGSIEYILASAAIERLEKIIRLWNDDRVTMACADMIAALRSDTRVRADSEGGVASNWSKGLPQESGWYWARLGPTATPIVVEFMYQPVAFGEGRVRLIPQVRYPGQEGLLDVEPTCAMFEFLGPITPTARSAVAGPTESPILAFETWLLRWVKDNSRKLTQTEYGIAYTAFIAAHPGEGPHSSVMVAAPTPSPDSVRATASNFAESWCLPEEAERELVAVLESHVIGPRETVEDKP